MNKEYTEYTDSQLLRLRAEELLKEKQNEMRLPAGETEIKKMLYELQVHQIELEMQNEELIQANETTEMALKKYTLLFDFAPIGHFTLDSLGIIYEMNFTCADTLGANRSDLIRANFRLFISDDYKPLFNVFLRKLYSSNNKESCELILEKDKNQMRVVYIEGIHIANDEKCFLSIVDLSRFKRKER